jgi:hypothetical protein
MEPFMKLLKKLNNPFLLGLQGFLLGAAVFFATHPGAAAAQAFLLS